MDRALKRFFNGAERSWACEFFDRTAITFQDMTDYGSFGEFAFEEDKSNHGCSYKRDSDLGVGGIKVVLLHPLAKGFHDCNRRIFVAFPSFDLFGPCFQ